MNDLERATDELSGMDKDNIPKPKPKPRQEPTQEPTQDQPQRSRGGYLGDDIEENLEGREAGRTRDDDADGTMNYMEKKFEGREAGRTRDDDMDGIMNYEEENLETTQDHHAKTDGTTINDETLDFVHLGGTRTNFDSNFIRFVLNEFVKKTVNHMASSATGLDANVVNVVTEPVVNAMPNLYDKLMGRGLNDYTRLNIDGKHQVFKTPTIPLLCITLYLYMVDKSPLFLLEINLIDSVIIKYTCLLYTSDAADE